MDLNDHLNEIEFTKGVFYIAIFYTSSVKCKLQNRETELVHPKWIRPSKASTILPLPVFLLIRDFGKQNTGGNVSKFSDSLACYWQIGPIYFFLLMDTHVIRTSTTRALWLLSQSFLQFSNLSKVLKFLKDIFNSEISCRNNKLIAGPRVVQFRE